MKALLLAAGYGKRLGHMTANVPKPLIEVGKTPMLGFCLREMERAGIDHVVVNAHYLSHQIEEYLRNFQTEMKVELSYERKLLGTAGTLKRHFNTLATEDFLVMHGDNYFSDSLRNMIRAHESRNVGSYGSVGVFHTKTPQDCGIVVLNPDKTIAEFHEKVTNPPSNLASGAIFIFTESIEKQLFLLTSHESDISRHLIPKLIPNLYTYKFKGTFLDIGTIEGLEMARRASVMNSDAR